MKRLLLAVLKSVWPPARRAVGWKAFLPAAIAVAAFLGAAAILDARGVVRFTRPAWLLLLPAAAPWIAWMHAAGWSALSGFRGRAALVSRLLLAGMLSALLAEPRAVRRNETLTLIYALDLSDSIGEAASEAAIGAILRIDKARPEGNETGLVVFARNAAVEHPPRKSPLPFEAVNARIAKDGTSIEKALSLSAAMIPEDGQGRILLMSDGVQTEGSAAAVLDELKSRGISVDVLPVSYGYEHEVWLERLDLPASVKIGETYESTLVLSSLAAGRGRLVLRENGQVVFEQMVDYRAGKNRFVLPFRLRGAGHYEYAASIEVPPGRDGWKENNVAVGSLFLKGEGKVLLVTDPGGDMRDWESLARALRAAPCVVEEKRADEFPRDPLTLLAYDAVIFANTPADAFDAVQLQALRDAVFNQGTGFLMVGGPNAFGPGGWNRTPVEEALPVSMDVSTKKVLPKGALALILHTCEFPEGNTWAKRIAKEAMRVLNEKDEVGILAWTGAGEGWVFPLTPAKEYERLAAIVNRCEPGDMPSFATTMQMGLDGLKKSDAAVRHMIIISDGDPSPPSPELVKGFRDARVSVSTIAVSPHGGVDPGVLQAIAKETGGRYYFPKDPSKLPSIFIKEAKTLTRSMIQEKEFKPSIEFPSQILKGLGEVPPLKGYVLTTPKLRSETILKGPEKEEIDPVLSVWRFGVGRTAAFTGDFSPRWGAKWLEWEGFRPFVKQLAVDISRVAQESDLRLRTFAAGEKGIVVIEDHHPSDRFLDVVAKVAGPGERAETVRLKPSGPRLYQGEFPLWGRGSYQVFAEGAGEGKPGRVLGGFSVPYSAEYLRFRSNPVLLREIAARTGGKEWKGTEKGDEIFRRDRAPRESSRPILDFFLLAIAILVPIDVGIRRIQLDAAVIRGWLGIGRKAKAEGTLGALLQRKRAIDFLPGVSRGASTPTAPLPPARRSPPPAAPASPPPPRPSEAASPPRAPQSMMERLLEAKRRAKDQGKNP